MGDQVIQQNNDAPGTALLFDTHHGKARVLPVPQPSLTDPNDPLKWPKLKKWLVLLLGSLYAFMGSVTGPIMAAGMGSYSNVIMIAHLN